MDPNSIKSTLSNLAFGNVMAAAARDYQKVLFLKLGPHLLTLPSEFDVWLPAILELIAQEKSQTSSSLNQAVDLDELMDDPELEKLHADRIAALKNAPFFVTKLGVKTLPCVIPFRKGISLVG
ncbi:thioredoxin domain-containing protein PLP3A isoform X1 [Hevea brasiliensis]|uniref:thioredoxin domain-containing protein PLP3A isoform X1 n=1 Tax=Hevea brasiliensis TaxID=3981 RepID=UPI0025F05707|nr:thioredoxin domain-containing protein PLP3A isoform X1 [Hevea brasiliensis]